MIQDFFVFVYLSSLSLPVIPKAPASPAKASPGLHLLTAIRSAGRSVGQGMPVWIHSLPIKFNYVNIIKCEIFLLTYI